MKEKRLAVIVQGQVQGVGFRPFVWRLAHELGLAGTVRNTSAGVRIEIQGNEKAIESLLHGLRHKTPPLAKIVHMETTSLDPLSQADVEDDFTIIPSQGHGGQNVLVSPDVGICPDCLADIRNPENHRYGYAFTNCVNCGPRYSITRGIPYDRKTTVMRCFEMCSICADEYGDPGDRRFHAQPIACAQCGPRLWYVDKTCATSEMTPSNMDRALERACELLLKGGILALKGLGGFQLACDAASDESVLHLRQRKNRPHKALAIMTADLETAENIAALNDAARNILQSAARPILVCPRKGAAPISPWIAPDCESVGIMLPNTPLHALIFQWLENHGMPHAALVMTSANQPGEPICLGNREALSKLDALADGWLLHNRDILARVDDSVLLSPAAAKSFPRGKNDFVTDSVGAPVFIRRARGYVPEPLELPTLGEDYNILGTGAELKATFCLTRGNAAFTSQHIGDMTSPATLDFYEQTLGHMQNLLEIQPQAIVHDLHPNFMSTRHGRELGAKLNLPVFELQHHVAHAAAVLAENRQYEPCMALCLDGAGLGADNNIWGGELLLVNLEQATWQRLGSLENMPLPGGDEAVRHPWRIALALEDGSWNGGMPPTQVKAIKYMLDKKLNCPGTSSCGRLFDAMSARLGLCVSITYEGQAAMRLMQAAEKYHYNKNNPPQGFMREYPVLERHGLMHISGREIFAACSQIFDQSCNAGMAAAAFHHQLAHALAALCQTGAQKSGLRKIALSGGVLQNHLLLKLLVEELEKKGLLPLLHKNLPAGDGCISFGQAVWGRQIMAGKAKKQLWNKIFLSSSQINF